MMNFERPMSLLILRSTNAWSYKVKIYLFGSTFIYFYGSAQTQTTTNLGYILLGILEGDRKESKQQADESAKQIKLLQGTPACL